MPILWLKVGLFYGFFRSLIWSSRFFSRIIDDLNLEAFEPLGEHIFDRHIAGIGDAFILEGLSGIRVLSSSYSSGIGTMIQKRHVAEFEMSAKSVPVYFVGPIIPSQTVSYERKILVYLRFCLSQAH